MVKEIICKDVHKHAYSIAEMAISITIIALIISGALSYVGQKSNENKVYITKQRMNVIDDALTKFFNINQFLPCPAAPRLVESDANFGVAPQNPLTTSAIQSPTTISNVSNIQSSTIVAQNTRQIATVAQGYYVSTPGQYQYQCIGINNSAYGLLSYTNTSANSDIYGNTVYNQMGVVPVRTLNLPDEYMYDGWGRKLSFRIAEGMGKASDVNLGLKAINIIDLLGNETTNSYNNKFGAAYVLISYGANGYQTAYSKNVTTPPISGGTGYEIANTKYGYNSDTTQNTVYIKGGSAAGFDDIIYYKPKLAYITQQKGNNTGFVVPQKVCGYLSQMQKYRDAYFTYSSGTPVAVTPPNAFVTPANLSTEPMQSLNAWTNTSLDYLLPLCKQQTADICNFNIASMSGIVHWNDSNNLTLTNPFDSNSGGSSFSPDKQYSISFATNGGVQVDSKVSPAINTFSNILNINASRNGLVVRTGGAASSPYLTANFDAGTNMTFVMTATFLGPCGPDGFVNIKPYGSTPSGYYNYTLDFKATEGNSNFCHINAHFKPVGSAATNNYNRKISLNIPRKLIVTPKPIILVHRTGQMNMTPNNTSTGFNELRMYTMDGDLYRARKMYTPQSTSSSNTLNNFILYYANDAAPANYSVDFGEHIFFNRVLSEDELAHVVSYLNLKWLKGACL